MTTLTRTRLNHARRTVLAHPRDRAAHRRPMPRRCMVIAVGLILAALTIPMLMAIDWLPTNFPLGFLGWALAALGGYRVLTQYGEIWG